MTPTANKIALCRRPGPRHWRRHGVSWPTAGRCRMCFQPTRHELGAENGPVIGSNQSRAVPNLPASSNCEMKLRPLVQSGCVRVSITAPGRPVAAFPKTAGKRLRRDWPSAPIRKTWGSRISSNFLCSLASNLSHRAEKSLLGSFQMSQAKMRGSLANAPTTP